MWDWEPPPQLCAEEYAIWVSGTGALNVTEWELQNAVVALQESGIVKDSLAVLTNIVLWDPSHHCETSSVDPHGRVGQVSTGGTKCHIQEKPYG